MREEEVRGRLDCEPEAVDLYETDGLSRSMAPIQIRGGNTYMRSQRGGVPFIVMVIIAVFFAGGTLGAFVSWWMGANAPTIVFSAFAFGILTGLVFIPNALKIIRWAKAVWMELKPTQREKQ